MAAAIMLVTVGHLPSTALRSQPNATSLQSCAPGSRGGALHPRGRVPTACSSEIWGSNVRDRSRAISGGARGRRSWKVKAESEEEKKKGSGKTALEEKNEPGLDKKQETDWKKDEDMKKFLSNPSIETLLKVEAKRTDQQLKDLETQDRGNFFGNLFADFRKNTLKREKERLDKAQLTFKAMDLNQVKTCFGFDTFYATDVRRFGDGGIFIGNIRRPLEEIKAQLEKKIKQVAGREVDIWFLEETAPDGESKQLCVVQPRAEIDLQFSAERLNNLYGYAIALLLGATTVGTIALTSGFFLQPGATYDDWFARILPLFGGFLSIIGVSEVATRVTAARYGVTLSPSFLIPSSWTGCLGVVNNYESLLPNKKALFDIAAARILSAYATSAVLALVAFYLDGSFNGGDNALIVRPQFFFNNPLLSFVQYVIGPYADELGNPLPQAVPGVGVPVDPLAFAGLLGIVVTSLNTLPCGKLEGGRMTQALFGRRLASRLSFFTSLLLGFTGLSGSVVSLVWAFVATFFRGGEELPAQDEITPIPTDRYVLGYAIAFICFLSLFPNSAGTFPSPLYTPPFFRNDF